jgi:hypothetical protein
MSNPDVAFLLADTTRAIERYKLSKRSGDSFECATARRTLQKLRSDLEAAKVEQTALDEIRRALNKPRRMGAR